MVSDNPKCGPVIAAIAASFLMLIGGLMYRILATPVNKTPINPAALERLPLQIGDWMGQDIPLDERTVRVAGIDAYVNRRYSFPDGLGYVSLYIGCGVNVSEVLGHRPEICYSGAGWILVDRRPMELPMNGGLKLPCSLFEFIRGGLGRNRLSVLNYLIVDGQFYSDISPVMPMAWRRFRAVDYVTRVQIVSTEVLTADLAIRTACAFAVDSAPYITRLFEDVEKDRNAGSVPMRQGRELH